ncbi:MAG: hypothetical protein ACI4J8_01765 [Oscillospiraceae bacterium]
MKQIKYSFKKEWLHFFRTFRFGGIIIAIFSFAISDPLMYRLMLGMMNMLGEVMSETTLSADISAAQDAMGMVTGMFADAGMVFALTMADICAMAVLIVTLILMSPAGGEQKKRATVIPLSSGLTNTCYLIPKFVMYPATVFAMTFLSALVSGGLCNALFDENHIGFGMLLLASLLAAIYCTFVITVYLAVGLCTSRPAVAAILVYIGSSLAQVLLTGFDITDYNPFTLKIMVTGGMFGGDFVLADNAASIAVGAAISVVLGVLMYFMTLAVLNAKKIDNQQADEPEF